jgi:hypothetical protein
VAKGKVIGMWRTSRELIMILVTWSHAREHMQSGGSCYLLPRVDSNKCFPCVDREGGHVVAKLVEALRYKPEGRGLETR